VSRVRNVTDYTVCTGAEHAHGGGTSNAEHVGTSGILNTMISGRGMDVADRIPHHAALLDQKRLREMSNYLAQN